MVNSTSPTTYHIQFAARALKCLRNLWRWIEWSDWQTSSGFQETSTGESYTYVGASRTGKHTIQANVSVLDGHIQLEVFCDGVSIASKIFGFSGASYDRGMDQAFEELVNQAGHMCALSRPHVFPVLAGLQHLIIQSQENSPRDPPEVVEQRLAHIVEEWLAAHNSLDGRKRLIYDVATLGDASLSGMDGSGPYNKHDIRFSMSDGTKPHICITKGEPLVIEVVFVDDASDEAGEESRGDIDDLDADIRAALGLDEDQDVEGMDAKLVEVMDSPHASDIEKTIRHELGHMLASYFLWVDVLGNDVADFLGKTGADILRVEQEYTEDTSIVGGQAGSEDFAKLFDDHPAAKMTVLMAGWFAESDQGLQGAEPGTLLDEWQSAGPLGGTGNDFELWFQTLEVNGTDVGLEQKSCELLHQIGENVIEHLTEGTKFVRERGQRAKAFEITFRELLDGLGLTGAKNQT